MTIYAGFGETYEEARDEVRRQKHADIPLEPATIAPDASLAAFQRQLLLSLYGAWKAIARVNGLLDENPRDHFSGVEIDAYRDRLFECSSAISVMRHWTRWMQELEEEDSDPEY